VECGAFGLIVEASRFNSFDSSALPVSQSRPFRSSTITLLVPPDRIVDLLKPFELALDETRLNQISIYIDLLVRWNVRINLTAIRDPEEIVTRHFGESLFTAKHLYPLRAGALARPTTDHEGTAERSRASHLIDVGSGPGFPGLPIKFWNPDLQ
jgi:16S rRNA (guanine527-N7)-methyltransferase